MPPGAVTVPLMLIPSVLPLELEELLELDELLLELDELELLLEPGGLSFDELPPQPTSTKLLKKQTVRKMDFVLIMKYYLTLIVEKGLLL